MSIGTPYKQFQQRDPHDTIVIATALGKRDDSTQGVTHGAPASA